MLGTFRNFIYTNSYLLKKLFHENDIEQYFKTANAMSLTSVILESPLKVLQMQYKLTALLFLTDRSSFSHF